MVFAIVIVFRNGYFRGPAAMGGLVMEKFELSYSSPIGQNNTLNQLKPISETVTPAIFTR